MEQPDFDDWHEDSRYSEGTLANYFASISSKLNHSFPVLEKISRSLFGLALALPIFYCLWPGIATVTLTNILLPLTASCLSGWLGYRPLFTLVSRLFLAKKDFLLT